MNERVFQKPHVCLKGCLKLAAAASIAVLACGLHPDKSQAANAALTFDDEFNSLSLWNGKSGTLTANARKNARNSHNSREGASTIRPDESADRI